MACHWGCAFCELRSYFDAQREVDRRFVYIDPRPDRTTTERHGDVQPIGFFSAIFGSLSTIPREQPIRDNLETLEQQSREALRLREIVNRLRPEVEAAVDRVFGRTLFLDRPTPKRLEAWRQRAQQAAAQQGYDPDIFMLDPTGHTVTRKGEPLDLTPLEFDLLVCLARKPWWKISSPGPRPPKSPPMRPSRAK